ncbi:MAG: hypothetical protein AAB250_00480 [Bdellovibrionota bacterium]
MAKKYLLFFSLGLLVGAVATLFFRPAEAPLSVTDMKPPVTCPVCPACEEMINKEAKLPPPTFADKTKEFIANEDGEATIRFHPVKGAIRSRVTVLDDRGGRVRTFSTRKDYVLVKDVPCPPDRKYVTFSVVLSSMSLLGQEGEFSEKRKLTIAGRPELIAPTIKTITVED